MTSPLAEKLYEKYFGAAEHPYQTFEKAVSAYLKPTDTLLDGGCGYTAPVLKQYRGKLGIGQPQETHLNVGMRINRRFADPTTADA